MFKVPPWEGDVQSLKVNNIKKEVNNKKPKKTANITQKGVSNGKIKKKKKIPILNVQKPSTQQKIIKLEKPSVPINTSQKISSKSETTQKKNSSQERKHKNNTTEHKMDSTKTQVIDIDRLDEVILNAKKKKINKFNHEEEKDVEETFSKAPKEDRKKQLLKKLLNHNRNEIKISGNSLRDRMLQRLKAAQFRYLNEKLYTSSGSDAQKLFKEDPKAFHTYHEGYQQQVKKWPVNPLEVIVKRIMKMPNTNTVADMGCGEAALSRRVPNKVRSFDLVAANSNVEVCDIAHTPLLSSSVDVAVYCLALMGTDLTQYMLEANRVLKVGGHLLIAEVESRFSDVESFAKDIQRCGFNLKKIDKSNKVFYFIEFTKSRDAPKKSKLPNLNLKPCLYKKR